MFVGNYNGINFYDISKPAQVKLITSLLCPGGQGDVSVYGHLLFMSVEAGNGRLDCGVQGIALPAGYVPPAPPPPPADGSAPRRVRPPDLPSPDRFKGVRVFDISDMTHPKQVAAVQTCRGSHTHTLLVDPKDKDNVYIYISGSAPVRPKDELTGCSGADPTLDPETALFTIVVIKVPVAHPELAKIVASPRIFTDETSGKMNGLMNAPVHGEGAARATVGCHDITVFESMGLAAGACSGNGILLDIRDPVHPKRLDAVNDPNYAFWHSANFANDGSKVLFTDEWGGGGQARCRAEDPMNWGADAIFKLNGKTDKLTLQSYYKMPAPQTDKENCVAHNGSLVPIPGRDILVQSWYQGGVSMVDFTDAGHPVEIGYFDRGPINDDKFSMGGQWSTYYYNGYIYGSEIARGVDVFKLVPNKFHDAERDRRGGAGAFERAECAEPAEADVAAELYGGEGVPGSTGARDECSGGQGGGDECGDREGGGEPLEEGHGAAEDDGRGVGQGCGECNVAGGCGTDACAGEDHDGAGGVAGEKMNAQGLGFRGLRV